MSSVYYFGEIIGCMIVARIPDLMGRKWPFVVCLGLQLPCFIVVYLSRSLPLTTGVGFIMGILHIGIANGGYINVCEYVQGRYKNIVCTMMLVFDMLTVIATGIYWKLISKNSSGLLLFGIACNALGLLGVLVVPESPEYLYCFYRFRECREVIFKIAKWNRSPFYKLIVAKNTLIE